MSENLKKYYSVVSFFRDGEASNKYYLRYDSSIGKADGMLKKLNEQHGYSLESALQIPFEIDAEDSFYNPAKQEAELFIEYIIDEISSGSSEEEFLGALYEIKKLEKDKWLSDFTDWKEKRANDMMVMESSPQQSLF